MKKISALAISFALSLSSCANSHLRGDGSGSAPTQPSVVSSAAGFDPAFLDQAAAPCQDFYQYACGGWIAKTEIPADQSRWSRGFVEVTEKNKQLMHEILEQVAKVPAGILGEPLKSTPYIGKLGDFYEACMDEPGAEKNSLSEFTSQSKKIDILLGVSQLPELLAALHLAGTDGIFNFSAEQDLKNPELMIGAADQGGLTLPDRDYYLSPDKAMSAIRTQYQDHITRAFKLLGESDTSARRFATTVIKVETELSEPAMGRVQRRDPHVTYHRLERAGLQQLSPSFGWDRYFQALGTPKVQAINVKVPRFFEAINQLLMKMPVDDLRIYLKWHLLDASIPALPDRFVKEQFRFVSQALSGQKELSARWKRCVKATDHYLGFALGRAFVDTHYGKEGKSVSQEILQSIEHEFGGVLQNLSWMDDATRKEALTKLSRIYNKIGYPDKWRNYDTLEVSRESYLKNVLAGEGFISRYWLDKIGKPVDRTEWFMTPPVVNAYYDASMNEMVFPAGILQPPFFAKNAPAFANYGGIGMVMGHELTHGFDDQGRKFDSNGSLRDWWSPAVGKVFDQKAECMAKQYDAFTVQDLHVNGKLTLGENIADQGGLKISFQAWKKYLATMTAQPETGGVTPEQKFFLSFAQTWCTKSQPQMERMMITVDPHSPPRYRVNGAVANLPEFAKAFGCSKGAPLAPIQACAVW